MSSRLNSSTKLYLDPDPGRKIENSTTLPMSGCKTTVMSTTSGDIHEDVFVSSSLYDRSFSDQQLVAYLQMIEDNPNETIRYFAITWYGCHPLQRLFFKAKTPEGAMIKIYRYMQEKKIPHFFGSRLNQQVEEIRHLLYDINPASLEDIARLCHEWIEDFTSCLDEIIIV